MSRMEGSVKWFSAEKGWGYITGDDQVDYHVHYTAIQSSGFRELEKGEKVSFAPVQTPRGLGAIEVRKMRSD